VPVNSGKLPARLLGLFVLLIVWQCAAWLLESDLLPGPYAVLISFWQQTVSATLPYHLGITLARVTVSFFIALVIGVAFGILMGSRLSWDRWLDGLLILGLNIPALVTIILCYIWFGLTESAAVLAVAINKIPTVIVAVREGARAIDPELMQVARVYRLKPTTTFFKVYLPQLYPYLFGAARNGLALIWKIVLVVELLGRSNGIGFQLGSFFQFFDIQNILAYTFAFIIVIFSIEAVILRPLENRLNRWRL
jgi:ABC-type nitrate/sulfonate/bicarbonate transport system permease component